MAALLALSVSTSARAQSLATEWLLSSDTDRFEAVKLRQSFSPNQQTAQEHWRWSLQKSRYRELDWTLHTSQLGLSYRSSGESGLQVESNVYMGEGLADQLITTENRVSFPLFKASRAEGFLVRDAVETRRGFETNRRFWLVGAGLETQWAEQWSTVLSWSKTEFSDRNTRSRLLTKLVFDLYPSEGVTVQIWHRIHRDDDPMQARGIYFSADRYRETLVLLGLNRRTPDLRVRARLGWGIQRVALSPESDSQLAEVSIEPLGKASLTFRTVLTLKRSAGIRGDSYTYRSLTQELIIWF